MFEVDAALSVLALRCRRGLDSEFGVETHLVKFPFCVPRVVIRERQLLQVVAAGHLEDLEVRVLLSPR